MKYAGDQRFATLADVPGVDWRALEDVDGELGGLSDEQLHAFFEIGARHVEARHVEDPRLTVAMAEELLRRPGSRGDYVGLACRAAFQLRCNPDFRGPGSAEQLALLALRITMQWPAGSPLVRDFTPAQHAMHAAISNLAGLYGEEGLVPDMVGLLELRRAYAAPMHTADARLLPERLERLREQLPVGWPAPSSPIQVGRDTPGARLLATGSVEEWLAVEAELSLRAGCYELDTLIAELAERAVSGTPLVTFRPDQGGNHASGRVRLAELPGDLAVRICQVFDPRAQQAAGAWWLPDDGCQVLPGRVNAAHVMAGCPQWAIRFIDWDRGWEYPHRDPCALLVWSVLGPLMDDLVAPLAQRAGSFLGARASEQADRAWQQSLSLYDALRINRSAVAPWLDGRALIDRPREDSTQARRELAAAWASAAHGAGERLRAHRMRALVVRYYEKAKDGRATRRQVLTGPTGRTLSGFFGGDWLAFLEYLGEQPHPREQIVRAVPEVRIVAPEAAQAVQAAEAAGVAPEQVQQILAAYWGGGDGPQGPIHRRVEVMKAFWARFDHLWTAHGAADQPLRWLSGEDRGELPQPSENSAALGSEESVFLAEHVLPSPMRDDIAELWGLATDAKHPDRRASCPNPRGQFALAFGPALVFWHRLAEAARDATLGGNLRLEIDDEPGHGLWIHQALRALEASCMAPDRGVLDELRTTFAGLPDVRYDWEDDDDNDDGLLSFERQFPVAYEVRPGRFVLRDTHGRARRVGWGQLNAIITAHRRRWAAEHLDSYLRSRWEEPVRTFGEWWFRRTADRPGRGPARRQIGDKASRVANHFFGGDIGALCRALGLNAPFTVTTMQLLPEDRYRFIDAVLAELGGTWWWDRRPDPDDDEPSLDDPAWDDEKQAEQLERLAITAHAVVRVWELEGCRRSIDELSAGNWAEMLGEPAAYEDAVIRALIVCGANSASIPPAATEELVR